VNDDHELSPEEELADQLPDDIDPREMADTLEDELLAEEGAEFGLDPDLAVFVGEEELDEEEPPS
jgi:hypothetical protein